MDSKDILREIQNKNHFVFKRLFDGLYVDLVTYANRYLFEKASCEDVVQEVYVCLWEKSNKIDLKTNLIAYMYAMVRNRCLNRLKAIKITDAAKILEAHAIFDTNCDPDWFHDDEKEIRYQKAMHIIENLPSKMRAIVELRFKENYRYKEIADEMDVSINTVKTQLKRAKIKLGVLSVSILLLLSILH